MTVDLLNRITVNPAQCGGRPCVRGMRIRVSDVLDLYAAGLSAEEILKELPDLEPEDERWLSEWAKREKGSDFIFITHYPLSKRPMYTYEDPDDLGYTRSFDLLFRGVEITTGGQRRHEYESLIEGIKMKGLDPEKFSYYLQAFKYGMPPHGGWGMGLERLTQKMLNLANVKEATLFPRDINRIDTLLSDVHADTTED